MNEDNTNSKIRYAEKGSTILEGFEIVHIIYTNNKSSYYKDVNY